ncbi:putative DNA repair and transcription factor Ada [Aspergillus lucknowensis]|uniref:Metal binding domain of Ada-domain-containing protein n=1 Tax=Aspergillus lucknowensis TaxID=176173 RepID=A0ABR4LMA3_9EURO
MSQRTTPRKLPPLPKKTQPATSAAARWQAVVNRDATATSFVYAVLTTKIYCRPSCSARLARRANVEFYDTPSQAEGAGFRACKRCKPETLKPAVNPQVVLVQRACQTIKSDIASGSKPTLTRIARMAGLTPSHFHRVFKKVMGVTPGKYAVQVLDETRAALEKEKPWDGVGGYADENRNPALFQPWDDKLRAEFDSWLTGGVDWDICDGEAVVGADGDPGALWNDFDVLLAAEAQFLSQQDSVCPLTGGLELYDSSESPGSVVVDERGFSFVGV